jgi:hypothetical protein
VLTRGKTGRKGRGSTEGESAYIPGTRAGKEVIGGGRKRIEKDKAAQCPKLHPG